MLWIKAFHIVFMVTWFAGLFYLPRLFVYHADTTDDTGYRRFCLMERRLSALMGIGALLTLALGLWLLWGYGSDWLAANGWMHAKLALVAGLVGYHGWCQIQVKRFRERRNRHGSRYFRWMNELPGLFLIGIVVLAVVRPF